jgi:surfeit locus 1 family protein
LFVATLALPLSLGFWQLDRADQKRRLAATFAERAGGEVVTLGSWIDDVDNWRFRQVGVAGVFDSSHQYLLDNQVRNGVAGYQVITPFVMDGEGPVVLVDRGWVPQGNDRSRLPNIGFASTYRKLKAMVNHFPQPGMKIGPADDGSAGWPRVIQYFDMSAVEQQLNASVLPVLLLLDRHEPDGFVREWAPATPRIGPERHEAYAVQWFALAFAFSILYLFVWVGRAGGHRGSD